MRDGGKNWANSADFSKGWTLPARLPSQSKSTKGGLSVGGRGERSEVIHNDVKRGTEAGGLVVLEDSTL